MANRTRKTVLLPRLKSQLNITPLIDILLVLIVIFMVVTPTMPAGQKAELPQQSAERQTAPKANEPALVLNVDQDRAITLNRMPLGSTAELSLALRDIFRSRGDRTIFIQGSRELAFNDIAQVIDAARGGGADRIGLMTDEIH
jgi:biopolymer transport protein ExbD